MLSWVTLGITERKTIEEYRHGSSCIEAVYLVQLKIIATGEGPFKSYTMLGLHCGPVVKNTPSNAGDVSSIPGWGTKIPHAAGQLSLCATTKG